MEMKASLCISFTSSELYHYLTVIAINVSYIKIKSFQEEQKPLYLLQI